jgi:predicted phage gp36 major capsid-like protein
MKETSMYEVKADPLEASFDAAARVDEVAELRAEMGAMKARIDAQAVAAARPALSGAKSEVAPERKAFVDAYLRKGVEGGVELKSFIGTRDGAFLWTPGLIEGRPDTLLGYPVVEAEDMPDIAANSLSIAFGNFAAGYLIAERSETQILRDPFTHKPFVHFYATKRVGGGVSNSEAIKLMKFSAS